MKGPGKTTLIPLLIGNSSHALIIPKQLAREGILELLGIQNLVFHVLTLLLKESAYRLTSIVIAGLDNKNTREKLKIPVFEGVGKRPKQKSYMK